jgi:hypothetical protein
LKAAMTGATLPGEPTNQPETADSRRIVSTAQTTRALVRAGFFLPVFILVVVVPADAQGKGSGNGRNKVKGGSGPVTSGSAAPASASVFAIRQFGAWLDDASLLTPGDATTSITFGFSQ